VLWLNASLGSGFGKLSKTFVPVTEDHAYSVCLHYTVIQVGSHWLLD
jgi:hypothetical protein